MHSLHNKLWGLTEYECNGILCSAQRSPTLKLTNNVVLGDVAMILSKAKFFGKVDMHLFTNWSYASFSRFVI